MSCDKHMQLNVLHFVVSLPNIFAQTFRNKQHLDSFKRWTIKNTRDPSADCCKSFMSGVCHWTNRTKIISHNHSFLHNAAGFAIIHSSIRWSKIMCCIAFSVNTLRLIYCQDATWERVHWDFSAGYPHLTVAHFIHVDTIMYNQFKRSYEIVQQQQDTFLKIYITAARKSCIRLGSCTKVVSNCNSGG